MAYIVDMAKVEALDFLGEGVSWTPKTGQVVKVVNCS
jgi:hypothetical protein